MPSLLHLDSSILGENSVSRALSAAVVARIQSLDPMTEVVYRDLAANRSRTCRANTWAGAVTLFELRRGTPRPGSQAS